MKRNISITVEEDIVNRIDDYSTKIRRSRSDVIETAIIYFLDDYYKEVKEGRKVERSL